MRRLVGALVFLSIWAVAPVTAADDWIEVKSAHFTVVSNASERTTRRLVWQFEQVRSATSALFSWAKSDLNRPLSIILVKDENSMRALAPEFWEGRRSIRPASVWTGGPDGTYIALRADVEVEDRGTLNPYRTAYWSYIDMVLGQSIGRDLPLWFRRGFTEVLSNTIVADDHILFGAPIPSELQILRERQLLLLPKLLTITRQSPEEKEATRREVFDAECWAFVHFLMFGDEGARSPKLAAYASLVAAGKDPAASFAETLGPSSRCRAASGSTISAASSVIAGSTSTSASSASAFRCGSCRRRSRRRYGRCSTPRCAAPSRPAPRLPKRGRPTRRPPAATSPRVSSPTGTTRSKRPRPPTPRPPSSSPRTRMRTSGWRS